MHKSYIDIQIKLHTAIESNEIEDIVFLAHNIKGSSGNIKAAPIYELAKKTELSAREGNDDAIALAKTLLIKLGQLNTAIGERIAEQNN